MSLQVICNDIQVNVYRWKGRPCWSAGEVSLAIGYKRANQVATYIDRDWSGEFQSGATHHVLRGKDLRDFKALADIANKATTRRALTLLFEPGLHLVLQLTHRPMGQVLRRKLAEDVLPQLARDGRYDPERQVLPSGIMVERERPVTSPERMLDIKERELTLRERQFQMAALRDVREFLERQGASQIALQTLAAKQAEIATGTVLHALKPKAPDILVHGQSPTEIGERHSVHRNHIGRIISRLGIRGDEHYSIAIANKAEHSDRTVTSYLYNDAGVALIEAELAKQA